MFRFSHSSRIVLMLGALCTVCTGAAHAGPVWPELADAGSLPGSAQTVAGSGPLKGIRGSTTGTPFTGPGDFEDMYLIYIHDPLNFCAKTILLGFDCCRQPYPVSQPTNFNTQLWIFKNDGTGVLGNDDDPADPPRSRVGSVATDPDAAAITVPGLYYIAISGGPNNDPRSVGGDIFNQAFTTETSSPDGPGGASPITHWVGGGPGMQYEIALCGASFVDPATIPTVSEWGLIALAGGMMLGGAVVIHRRRRAAMV